MMTKKLSRFQGSGFGVEPDGTSGSTRFQLSSIALEPN